MKNWQARFCTVCLIFLTLGVLWGCSGGDGDGNNNDSGGENGPPSGGDPPQSSFDWDAADFDHVYDIGPGQSYSEPSQVPWESLQPSTLIRIFYRDTPYRNKWLITTTATADDPVVVLGMPDNGRLPVISGEDATTRDTLYYLNDVRSVVKVGNYTGPADVDRPAFVYLQNLEIRSGRPGYTFYNDEGVLREYNDNAAAVHIEEGDHIVILGCELHDCGNGLFNSHFSSNILIRQNYIHDNGIEGRIYEHNSYTESQGITFEFNHYGALRSGCLGNNLKDRSSGTVIRYNWIEGGNRQLDLVETGWEVILNDPAYNETFVYGNILIEPDGAGNSQILHYGGDGGNTTMYRQGTLYFYHNTVISTRSGNTTLMRLSTNTVHADVRNNVIMADAGGSYLAITSGNGQTLLDHNWLPSGWRETHEASLDPGASITATDNITGADPGFVDPSDQDFELDGLSDCLNAAGPLAAAAENDPVDQQYLKHEQGQLRKTDGFPDLGAFENNS
jgi:hypothetical protein